uniref:tropinone reductase-like 3 n=1 Tax=Erigeron canadensis TaxID=72917 RepID=UPI001CB9C0C6|nr:tropinone reductase-like 3 [Erigeron canadensis]
MCAHQNRQNESLLISHSVQTKQNKNHLVFLIDQQTKKKKKQEIKERKGMEKTSSKMIGRRFEGKVAIVTASTQGIGFAIALRLGLEGASVVISSRRQRNVDEAVKKLQEQGIEVLGLVCHVSNAQQRKNLIDQTIQKYGKIDVVVSNAAANPSVDAILETKESALDKLWEINVKTSILLLQDASPHLSKGSSIVFISSISAFQPPSGLAMYGVTKTALLGLTKALANELAPHTRVNCVAPGFVPTHFAEFITTNAAMKKAIEDQTPLKRLGTTEDMAAATAFLASDDASYITGETIVVAGGAPSRL